MIRRARFPAIGRMCSPEKIIRPSRQDEKMRYRDGDTGDIIETILAMDADNGRWVNVDAVECLRGETIEETLRNVWAFVKKNNTYRADKAGHERVKSPGALFASRSGDCKSYSIAEGAILKTLGIRYKYRFAAYEPGGDYTHVYILAATPKGWVPLDAVHSEPFAEVRYTKKKDIALQRRINGLPESQQLNSQWAIILIAFFLLLK